MKYTKRQLTNEETAVKEEVEVVETPVDDEVIENVIEEESTTVDEIFEEKETTETAVEEVAEEPVHVADGYIVNTTLLNVRKAPNKNSDIVKTVAKDTKLDILKIESNASEGCTYGYVEGENAWVNMTFLKHI